MLANLDAAGGRLRLGDLGASIVLSPSGLSKLLDRMQASDLVRREPDPDDPVATEPRWSSPTSGLGVGPLTDSCLTKPGLWHDRAGQAGGLVGLG